MKKFKEIYNKYHYLALMPYKIDCALGLAGIMLILFLIGLNFCLSVFFNFFSILWLIISLLGFIISFVYIADLQEYPVTDNLDELRSFDFRKSLKETRLLQKELRQNIGNSRYIESANTFAAKYNNMLRLLSFTVVFDAKTYVFIRLPQNVDSRRDIEELQTIVVDIAEELNLNTSQLIDVQINTKLFFGHYRFQKFKVAVLR